MSVRRPRPSSVLLAGVFVALILSPVTGPAPFGVGLVSAEDRVVQPGPTTPLSVDTRTGVYPFQVELADEPGERAQGLMWRRSMPADHGMLFDMGREGEATFWMENTFIPLDIVFIAGDGTVVRVAEDTTPMSRDLVESGAPVRFVLELNAGTARRIGLKPGDTVAHPAIEAVGGG